MIYFYWPRKPIPEWLETIEFSGKSHGVPTVFHNGFGIAINWRGGYQVFGIGTFVKGDAKGMSVEIIGGGNGVTYHALFRTKENAMK